MAEFQTNSNSNSTTESYVQTSQYNIISSDETMIQFDNEDIKNDLIDYKDFI